MKERSNNKSSIESLLNETLAARFLGLSKRTLQKWRVEGSGPAFVRILNRAIRYRPSDLQEWVEGNICNSTYEYKERALVLNTILTARY